MDNKKSSARRPPSDYYPGLRRLNLEVLNMIHVKIRFKPPMYLLALSLDKDYTSTSQFQE